jgi:hypothetical protein
MVPMEVRFIDDRLDALRDFHVRIIPESRRKMVGIRLFPGQPVQARVRSA